MRDRSDGWFGDLPGATAATWVSDSSLMCPSNSWERGIASCTLWLRRERGYPYVALLEFGLDGSGVPTLTTTRKLLGAHSWSIQRLSHVFFQRAVHRGTCDP